MNERMLKIHRELELRERAPELDFSLMIPVPFQASEAKPTLAQLPDLVIG